MPWGPRLMGSPFLDGVKIKSNLFQQNTKRLVVCVYVCSMAYAGILKEDARR